MDELTEPEQEPWPLAGDPHATVGTRHHLLPQLHQRYFGNDRGMISTVDRSTGRRHTAPITDTTAEKDFYTSIDHQGLKDGRSDHLLTRIEDRAAPVIHELVRHGMFAQFPPTPEQRSDLCLFLAFQMTRGRSVRRLTERLGDLYMHLKVPKNMSTEAAKAWLTEQGHDTDDETIEALRRFSAIIDDVEFLPDPNEHIAAMGPLALKLYDYLISRPWYVLDYPQPCLLTCDEPVVLFFEDGTPPGRRAGLARADQVWFPLSRQHLLVLGQGARYGPERRVQGDPSHVANINLRIAANAYESIHMHPDDDPLAGLTLPEPGPLFRLTDGIPELRRFGERPANTRTRRRR